MPSPPIDRDDQPPPPTPPPDAHEAAEAEGAPPGDAATSPAEAPLRVSALGSGLLARQPTPEPDAVAAVPKVCPQCGTEYETGSRFCVKDGAALRPKAGDDPLVGRVIADRYLILARLGEGGMGRVYLAEHLKMNRQCAVKVMNPNLVNDHESAMRFAREASNAAQILHSNVAAVFDFGESDRIVYLVMEYVDGESLSAILAREGALEPRRAVDMARQIADGLTAAHELGIVHRDLKPDNIIVGRARTGRDVPKIVDFGIAKAVSETPQDSLTRSGLVIGTPEYMSPEQLLGDPIDARTDVYSLGCIVYQMLTGSTAFADESREQMIRRRLHEAPPHVGELLPGLPRRLDTTITHMLARSPAERLATAAEARDALDPALIFAEWGPQANPVARATQVAAQDAPTTKITPAGNRATFRATLPLRRQGAGMRRVGAGIGVAAVLVLGAGVLWARRHETPPPSTAPPQDSVAVVAPVPTPLPSERPPSETKRSRLDSIRGSKAAGDSAHRGSLSPETLAMRQPLQAFSAAMESGDMKRIRGVYPRIADLGDFFSRIENIRARPSYGPATTAGDRAELEFSLLLRYDQRNSKVPGSSVFRYHVVLVRADGGWQIVELAPQA